jgi:hypothetical protein
MQAERNTWGGGGRGSIGGRLRLGRGPRVLGLSSCTRSGPSPIAQIGPTAGQGRGLRPVSTRSERAGFRVGAQQRPTTVPGEPETRAKPG